MKTVLIVSAVMIVIGVVVTGLFCLLAKKAEEEDQESIGGEGEMSPSSFDQVSGSGTETIRGLMPHPTIPTPTFPDSDDVA